jgi:hypothetical protein
MNPNSAHDVVSHSVRRSAALLGFIWDRHDYFIGEGRYMLHR